MGLVTNIAAVGNRAGGGGNGQDVSGNEIKKHFHARLKDKLSMRKVSS